MLIDPKDLDDLNMSTSDENSGKRVKVVSVTRLAPGVEVQLHDFQISASDSDGMITMVDFALLDKQEYNLHKYEVKPGFWRVTPEDGMQLLELPEETYFETDTSRKLLKFFNNFRTKLHIYDRYRLKKKRSILLGSIPGVGKSSLINYFLRSLKKESNVCVLKIDSSDVSWETMTQMFMKSKPDSAELVVLIIEDIGGTSLDNRLERVSSDMLNFLSGNSDVFKIPTLIVATTNFLNELSSTLTDRPDRFDRVEQVNPPKDEEVMILVESFIGRAMTEEEKKALLGKRFTPPYCIEAITRSEIDELTIEEAVAELVKQREKSQSKKHGERHSSLGFNAQTSFFEE